MSEPAIKIRGIGKEYLLGATKKKGVTFREVLAGAGSSAVQKLKSLSSGERQESRSFWALEDVSFDVPQGEIVGLIGRNGAGKSTLLKVLSRITEPTRGTIDISGRVGSLLEVGTGFHPELTGRENIYLNGAILGMRRREIDRRFDEIVAFSEVEKFVDTAVKHYSSGMYLRLAFAVAAHLETEILLVDEVLAVGDAIFQKKCLGKMSEVATAGRTVILVSHNMLAISRLCTQAVLLSKGQVESIGPADEVIDGYMRETLGREAAFDLSKGSEDGFHLTDAKLIVEGRETGRTVRSGDAVDLHLAFESGGEESFRDGLLWLAVKDANGNPLFLCNSLHSSLEPVVIPPRGVFKFHMPRLPLIPGNYSFSVLFKSHNRYLARYDDFLVLEVLEGDYFGTGKLPSGTRGSLLVDHQWSVEPLVTPKISGASQAAGSRF